MKYGLHLLELMMGLGAPIRLGRRLDDPIPPFMRNPRFDRERLDAAAARRAARNAKRAATRR